MVSDTRTLARLIQRRCASHVLAAHHYRGQQTVLIRREGLLQVARFLKDDRTMAFDVLMDLTAVDYLKFGTTLSSAPTLTTPSPLPYYMTPKVLPEKWERMVASDQYRFEVVYHFYSTAHNHRLRLKAPLPAADPVVDSVTGLWAAANWFEREAWDMFGIAFRGHPNLKRLLMYEGFVGHPLRKDYPVNRRQPLVGPVN
ncbi:MAG: NADH-quinone oxidoreductase subunit C [Candidatus Omnitrophica bacterium]|nr:NADH-quinone oxidoreductase subunit C [Candidatus Omnitrophota bacterium]